jgi:hypothetical protein
VREVREQHERREARRADCITLRHRLGGVAHCVERIGDVTDLLVETRHLGDAAGVVRDRAVGVERHDHAGQRQHRRCRDRDAVQAAELIRTVDREADRDDGQRRRLHRHAQARNDVGGMAGL